MMGQKVMQEKFFYNFSLSQRVPEDHILRRLAEVLDLSFVRQLTAPFYSYTGQPSIDPVVLFKMMLLGYLYGITSERKLAEECNLNLAYMWYLGYDLDEITPDHSVISKARVRYGKETFEKFFEHVLDLCVKAGLVSGEKLFMDSTLIRANASLNSMVPRSDAFHPHQSAKEHVAQVFSENPVVSDSPEPTVAKAKKDIDTESETNQIPGIASNEHSEYDGETASAEVSFGKGRSLKPRRDYNWSYVSSTDPDASVITRPAIGRGLFYKQHFAVDFSRVITAVLVTPGAVDDSVPVSEILDRQPITPKTLCADTNYGVPAVYADLKRRGIHPVVPRRTPHMQQPRPGRLHASTFRYDPEMDIYHCPQNKTLRRKAFDARYQSYQYRPQLAECKMCPLKKACAPGKSVRTIVRAKEEEAITWALGHLGTKEAEKVRKERSVIAEGIVGEAKGLHGLRRAVCRGLYKVNIQSLLTATVQNLKRLLKSQTWRYCPA